MSRRDRGSRPPRLGQQTWRMDSRDNTEKLVELSDMESTNSASREDKRRAEALDFNNKGHKKYLQVDFDDAIADYTTAIELDPSLAVAYFNRGTVHYRLGSYDLALVDMKKSVQLEPDNPTFAEGLRECLKMCES